MAEAYQTEEEQIEAIKKWWSENGRSTVVSIVVAIAGVFGWQAWQDQKQTALDTASAIYQDMLVAASGNTGNASPEQLTTANHLAGQLKEQFPDSTYSIFAALYKAKFAVQNNDLDAAEQELRWVLERGTTTELSLQTKLRLARVLFAKSEFEEALTLLTTDAAGYASSYQELIGDIKQSQGDYEQALQAYQRSAELIAQEPSSPQNPFLQLKIQQLKNSQQATAVSTDEDA